MAILGVQLGLMAGSVCSVGNVLFLELGVITQVCPLGENPTGRIFRICVLLCR